MKALSCLALLAVASATYVAPADRDSIDHLWKVNTRTSSSLSCFVSPDGKVFLIGENLNSIYVGMDAELANYGNRDFVVNLPDAAGNAKACAMRGTGSTSTTFYVLTDKGQIWGIGEAGAASQNWLPTGTSPTANLQTTWVQVTDGSVFFDDILCLANNGDGNGICFARNVAGGWYCWGASDSGSGENACLQDAVVFPPVAMSGTSEITQIFADYTGLYVGSDANLTKFWIWGPNTYGIEGLSTGLTTPTPLTEVPGAVVSAAVAGGALRVVLDNGKDYVVGNIASTKVTGDLSDFDITQPSASGDWFEIPWNTFQPDKWSLRPTRVWSWQGNDAVYWLFRMRDGSYWGQAEGAGNDMALPIPAGGYATSGALDMPTPLLISPLVKIVSFTGFSDTYDLSFFHTSDGLLFGSGGSDNIYGDEWVGSQWQNDDDYEEEAEPMFLVGYRAIISSTVPLVVSNNYYNKTVIGSSQDVYIFNWWPFTEGGTGVQESHLIVAAETRLADAVFASTVTPVFASNELCQIFVGPGPIRPIEVSYSVPVAAPACSSVGCRSYGDASANCTVVGTTTVCLCSDGFALQTFTNGAVSTCVSSASVTALCLPTCPCQPSDPTCTCVSCTLSTRAAAGYQAILSTPTTCDFGDEDCCDDVAEDLICRIGNESVASCSCPGVDGYVCPDVDCDSDDDESKKGLLGLLGLLGLIPLLLCVCAVVLACCCLRRKKVSEDVQFATFDPFANPIATPVSTLHAIPVSTIGGTNLAPTCLAGPLP